MSFVVSMSDTVSLCFSPAEVPPSMQKVMIRGLARDDKTLRQLGVASGAKVMVVGSTLNDVLSVAKPDTKVSCVIPRILWSGGRG